MSWRFSNGKVEEVIDDEVKRRFIAVKSIGVCEGCAFQGDDPCYKQGCPDDHSFDYGHLHVWQPDPTFDPQQVEMKL